MVLFAFLILVAVAVVVPAADNNGDANVYSFGSNPNVAGAGRQKMYRADAAAVLDDLDSFSALYVKYHSCAWSPNQAYFDDDGEYRDGDEYWYQGRTPYYAANAAFSLYGSMNNQFLDFVGRGCTKGSYINSFFTNNGADVLIEALGIDGVETGSGYCQAYGNGRGREMNEGNNNNNKNNNGQQSAMMGCSEDGQFVTVLFDDNYCQGKYFSNVTVDDGQYQSYNRALNGLGCKKIWNGGTEETSSGYESAAHEILMQSDVCDLDVSPYCPDPWGKKSIYSKNFALAQSGRSVTFHRFVRTPMMILSTVTLVLGLGLSIYAYCIRNQQRVEGYLAEKEGRSKVKAILVCVYRDMKSYLYKRFVRRSNESLQSGIHRTSRRRNKNKKNRSAREDYRSHDESTEPPTDYACGASMSDWTEHDASRVSEWSQSSSIELT